MATHPKSAWYKRELKGFGFKGHTPLERPPLCSICASPREDVNSRTCGGIACLHKYSENQKLKLQMALDRGDISETTYYIYVDCLSRAEAALGRIGGVWG